nr:MAG TPA: hyaluronidase [Caudoviricetes sp.]
MTKIQLRRDTASNWSTNNPTPSEGEPCFETDTGKLKIGDGSTKYNDLVYQGSGSASANMVTTDTEQEITGLKTFANDIVLRQWNSSTSPIREAHIDLSNGNQNQFITADGTDKTFGMYSFSSDGIQLGTSKTDFTQGLSVKPSSLTFKSSDGTTTDLLAGGSGDVTTTGNNTFTGTNIFKGQSLCVGDSNNYSNIAKYSGKEYVVGDQEDTTIFNPVILGSVYGYTVLSHNVRVLEYDKASTADKAYSIMTKSPTNNKYMAHMAMPSDKFIDLELGASGTTYTAPADGYVRAENNGAASNPLKLLNVTNNLSDVTVGGSLGYTPSIFIPCKKGDTVQFYYTQPEGSVTTIKFIYAIGSEPAS